MAGPMGLSQLPNLSIQTESRPGVRLGHMAKTEGQAAFRNRSPSFSKHRLKMLTRRRLRRQGGFRYGDWPKHNIHEMMIALDRADVSFRLATKVRNKAVEAY